MLIANMENPAYNARTNLLRQIVILSVIVVVFLYLTGQLTAPYIAHDDLDMLMPWHWQDGYATAWQKTLAEGRWVNYMWYHASTYLHPRSTYLLFILVYLTATCALASLASSRWVFLICSLALFVSPMAGDLSLWPTGGFSAYAICAIALISISITDERFALPILFVATAVLVAAYPPISSIVLMAASFKQTKTTLWSKAALGLVYLVAFAMGVLCIYALNYIFHAHFGVEVASWRQTVKVHSVASLLANLNAYADTWKTLLHHQALPIMCGVVAAGVLLYRGTTRSRALAILFAVALSLCVEVGITVISGTPVPVRSVVWLWAAIVLLCALVATQMDPPTKYFGSALLVVLIVAGGFHWWTTYAGKRSVVAYETKLATMVQQHDGSTGLRIVTIAGNPYQVAELQPLIYASGGNPMPALKMVMFKQYNIRLQDCDYSMCQKIQTYMQQHHLQAPAVFDVDGQPVLAFSQGGIFNITRNYPTHAMEASLKLGYPLILHYGRYAARITPLYPGTGKYPVSVALPPAKRGYALAAEGQTCAFPINYDLTTTNGEQLASGQYTGPHEMSINRTAEQQEVTILSLSMGAGATNNYGCNLIVSARNAEPNSH